MTHEELLAKIHKAYLKGHTGYMSNALRAVVELHKPRVETAGCDCCETITVCNACDKGNQMYKWISYPCPTIQAIEKELK